MRKLALSHMGLDLPRGDEPFNQVELCMTIRKACSKELIEACVAKRKLACVPASATEFKEDLMAAEPEAKRAKQLAADVKAVKRNDKKASSSEAATFAGSKKKFRQKNRGAGKLKDNPGNGDNEKEKQESSGAAKKHCNRCQQWSPKIAGTHNAAECRRWHPDGEPRSKRIKSAHAQAKEMEQMKSAFAAMQEKMNSLQGLSKKKKKAKKSHKKKKCYESSDGSSDSDSE